MVARFRESQSGGVQLPSFGQPTTRIGVTLAEFTRQQSAAVRPGSSLGDGRQRAGQSEHPCQKGEPCACGGSCRGRNPTDDRAQGVSLPRRSLDVEQRKELMQSRRAAVMRSGDIAANLRATQVDGNGRRVVTPSQERSIGARAGRPSSRVLVGPDNRLGVRRTAVRSLEDLTKKMVRQAIVAQDPWTPIPLPQGACWAKSCTQACNICEETTNDWPIFPWTRCCEECLACDPPPPPEPPPVFSTLTGSQCLSQDDPLAKQIGWCDEEVCNFDAALSWMFIDEKTQDTSNCSIDKVVDPDGTQHCKITCPKKKSPNNCFAFDTSQGNIGDFCPLGGCADKETICFDQFQNVVSCTKDAAFVRFVKCPFAGACGHKFKKPLSAICP